MVAAGFATTVGGFRCVSKHWNARHGFQIAQSGERVNSVSPIAGPVAQLVRACA